jgi:hypothetical protein
MKNIINDHIILQSPLDPSFIIVANINFFNMYIFNQQRNNNMNLWDVEIIVTTIEFSSRWDPNSVQLKRDDCTTFGHIWILWLKLNGPDL